MEEGEKWGWCEKEQKNNKRQKMKMLKENR
jgi:hypothetical protein